MKRSDNAHITTIEGLANGTLHPIQQAYIDQGATQCGFCTPGFIMATKALLDKHPDPTLAQIYDGHKFNICRCTGHNAILRAIQQAAGQTVAALPAVKQPLNAISRPLPRPDAIEKVTGAGIYADDLYVEGMLYARALRSAHPHALLNHVDVSRAKVLPGVVAVLTAADIPGRKDCGVHEIDWPVLCYDKVRYVGDAVALVVAESEDIAARALELIDVGYTLLPVISGPKEPPVCFSPNGSFPSSIRCWHPQVSAQQAKAPRMKGTTSRPATAIGAAEFFSCSSPVAASQSAIPAPRNGTWMSRAMTGGRLQPRAAARRAAT